MTTYRVAVWTGPTLVDAFAERMRTLGARNVVEGTERVYFEVDGATPAGAAWDAQVEYERRWGGMGGFRFVPA